MKFYIVYIISCLLFSVSLQAQSTYYSTNYAVNGDTIYLTKAQLGSYNFDTTGANITWNYSSLTAASQNSLIFLAPTQTGFSIIQWPYVYNSTNVNLSSTDGQTIAVGGLEETNPNNYYLKNTSALQQKASSFTIAIDNSTINIKNVYTNPDTIYRFPLLFGNTYTSHGSYTISIPPNLYYQNVIINRVDSVNGWGTVITSYGTFSNCLKLVSYVTEIDSIAINNNPIDAIDTVIYKQLQWFDPSKGYPVLSVTEDKVVNSFITQTIQYFDSEKFFQPQALFAYYPLTPNMGDTVTFQNLSTNAQTYKWYFGDTSSGTNDSSTQINPQHSFVNPGTYSVELIAYTGPLTDTFNLSIVVNPVNFTYTFNGNGNWSVASNWSNNLVPPSTLSANNSIVIDPVIGGQCILNVTQHISSGATITIMPGKVFIIPELLSISQ